MMIDYNGLINSRKKESMKKYVKKRKLSRQFSNGELLWDIKTRNRY